MKGKLILISLILLVTGCDKDEEIPQKKETPADLLTQKEWIITGAGFDDNKNEILDPQENTIEDCQKDNTYTFLASGSGSIDDNALSCGNPVNSNFQWSFQENETRLKINTESTFIRRLNKEEMILSPDLPWLNVNFLIVYRH